jgi:hypothetical protein
MVFPLHSTLQKIPGCQLRELRLGRGEGLRTPYALVHSFRRYPTQPLRCSLFFVPFRSTLSILFTIFEISPFRSHTCTHSFSYFTAKASPDASSHGKDTSFL